MTRVFISYRRDDSAAYAGRLYDRLTAHFGQGQVFMDIDQIEPGEDFVDAIERTVSACESAVVLIGKGWLGAADSEGNRRLDDPDDFVRLEVAAALRRKIKVFPVLVGGAAMPKTPQLPEPLQMLARRNAIEISDTRFHADVNRLIEAIAKSLGTTPAAAARSEPTAPTPGTVNITSGAIPARAPTPPSPQREGSPPPVHASEPIDKGSEAVPSAGLDLQPQAPRANRKLIFAAVGAVILAVVGIATFRTLTPTRDLTPVLSAVSESESSKKVVTGGRTDASIKLRTQDTYGSGDKRSSALRAFAKTLDADSSVRFDFEILPSGSVARSFEALDAVANGTIDAAWVSASFYYGKSPAFALIDEPPFGPNPTTYVQWRQDPKVKAIVDELYGKFGVTGLLCGVTGPNADLWSRKKIDRPGDLKGLKTRAVGLKSEILTAAGMAVSALPAGEIYPALERGLLDAVQLSDVPLGVALGLPNLTKYVYFPGNLAPSSGVDLIINARLWSGMVAEGKISIEQACQSNVRALLDASNADTRNALSSLTAKGVTAAAFPTSVRNELQTAWMRVANEKSSDPIFARLFATVPRPPAPTL